MKRAVVAAVLMSATVLLGGCSAATVSATSGPTAAAAPAAGSSLSPADSPQRRSCPTPAFPNLMNGSENHLAAFTAAKDGKNLAARNGQGMQNGRSGANSAWQGWNGRGQGMNAGTGAGRGLQGDHSSRYLPASVTTGPPRDCGALRSRP